MVKYSTGYLQIQDVLYEDEPSMDNSMLYDEALKQSLMPFEKDVVLMVPRLQSFALIATDETTRGVMVTGIDPESENKFNNLTGLVTKGSFLNPGDNAIVIAQGLSGILNTNIGDTLVLISQGYQGSMAAGKFPVKGIIRLRVPELNNNIVYMSLEAARQFYSAEDRLTSLIIMPKNPDETDELAMAIGGGIDKEWYKVLTWKDMLKDLLKLMEFDVASNMIIIYILYIVIAFGIFGTILTMMIERSKEFGMLISLGMKRKQLALVCLFESLLMSFTGAIAGAVLALPVVAWYHTHPIRFEDEMAEMMLQYGFEPISPFSADPMIFVTQAWIVFIMAMLIGLYPVYKIFRLKTVETSKR